MAKKKTKKKAANSIRARLEQRRELTRAAVTIQTKLNREDYHRLEAEDDLDEPHLYPLFYCPVKVKGRTAQQDFFARPQGFEAGEPLIEIDIPGRVAAEDLDSCRKLLEEERPAWELVSLFPDKDRVKLLFRMKYPQAAKKKEQPREEDDSDERLRNLIE